LSESSKQSLHHEPTPIREFLQQSVENGVFPGCAVSVGKIDGPWMEEGFGFLSTEKKSKPTADTLYDVASLTKVMSTSTLLMKARDQQDFELSDLVLSFLPDLKHDFLMHHLMTHSSGLPAWMPLFEGLAPHCTKAQMFQAINNQKLEQPPGEKAVYSDLGFMLLGFALEEIFPDSLENLFNEHVSQNLSLKRTCFSPRSKNIDLATIAPTERCAFRKQMVHGEVHDENAFVLGGVAGHAGLFSTAHEAGIFARSILRNINGEAIFAAPEIVREFASKQFLPNTSTWALCWDTPSPENSSAGILWSRQGIGHLGYSGCSIWIDLPKKCYAVVLSNRVHPTRENDKIKNFRPQFHDLLQRHFFA